MEKLTQFVSKSFENNNNEHCHMTFEVKNSSVSPLIKIEKELCDDVKKPKNWLISDIEKPVNTTVGIDLRLNPSRNFFTEKCNESSETSSVVPEKTCDSEKTKWCKNNLSIQSQDPYLSSSEVKTVDETNSEKSCEKSCEKTEDCNKDTNVSEESDHKI
uniref:Uncharacterized protein LOC114343365 n=1 Tax=Diabrotica virgifera virgifera TaxID=50390 RepID=A0A6P7GK04_DIAVI